MGGEPSLSTGLLCFQKWDVNTVCAFAWPWNQGSLSTALQHRLVEVPPAAMYKDLQHTTTLQLLTLFYTVSFTLHVLKVLYNIQTAIEIVQKKVCLQTEELLSSVGKNDTSCNRTAIEMSLCWQGNPKFSPQLRIIFFQDVQMIVPHDFIMSRTKSK